MLMIAGAESVCCFNAPETAASTCERKRPSSVTDVIVEDANPEGETPHPACVRTTGSRVYVESGLEKLDAVSPPRQGQGQAFGMSAREGTLPRRLMSEGIPCQSTPRCLSRT
jgi:hypothetical protein